MEIKKQLPSSTEPLYYTLKDIQIIFHCGRDKAFALVQIKSFPKIKIGGRYYIDREEFNKWRKANLYTEISLY